ncbi:MAG: GNAT family N-acetyltransferase, partial [Actinobacteria bacterium]|nr:GNAT family N-acetyltransferase [Actinomycetota bacterium]
DYLRIEFDAFYEKLSSIYGNRRDAAYNIIKAGIISNFDSGRFMNALYRDRPVGIIELVTKENSENYKRDFPLYLKYLGPVGAVRAYFLTFLDLPQLDGSTIYMDNIAVDIDKRRRGVATNMISFVEDLALNRGKNKLCLWVAQKNSAAYHLYQKSGFKQLMSRSSGIAEKYFGFRDWVFMGKTL